MRIHIFGASGSGVTTLGQALSAHVAFPYFDADDYYWIPTDPPFQQKRDPVERNALLLDELNHYPNWIVGGSLDSWGPEWPPLFDLVVFLWIPSNIRIDRLWKREFERYGEQLVSNPDQQQRSDDFINWSSEYDSGLLKGRSKQRHEAWMSTLSCPIIRLEGDLTVDERVNQIVKAL